VMERWCNLDASPMESHLLEFDNLGVIVSQFLAQVSSRYKLLERCGQNELTYEVPSLLQFANPMLTFYFSRCNAFEILIIYTYTLKIFNPP
jgi:hypothetical protein